MGKVTIIKSLALSKLSHVVLVTPHLEDGSLKALIDASFKFLWSGNSDRIKRKIAHLPIAEGGLNMPDIPHFWNSLKCSWIRRLANSEAGWHHILQHNLEEIGTNLNDIWYTGPEEMNTIAKNLSNPFWKEFFKAMSSLQNANLYSNPENIFFQNIFGNYGITRNNNSLKKADFPQLNNKQILQVGDFYHNVHERPYSWEEFKNKYGVEIDFLTFEGLKHAIKACITRVAPPDLDYSNCLTPRVPMAIKIIGGTKKGCRNFYKCFTAKDKINVTKGAEDKWRETLQTNLSLQFWEKIWKLPNESFLPNKLKFLQIQINNHVLPTNYSVSKYNPMTSPLCTFCQTEPERYNHIFFDCQEVQHFYEGVKNILDNIAIPITFLKRFCIFGSNCSRGNSKENIILTLCRGFIWKQKAKKSNLNICLLYTSPSPRDS